MRCHHRGWLTNPVVLLDEIGTRSARTYRGRPAAALLEVLDPAQNHTFLHHDLEVDLDLSDGRLLFTANVVETIPQALLDRMEPASLDGYTKDHKHHRSAAPAAAAAACGIDSEEEPDHLR